MLLSFEEFALVEKLARVFEISRFEFDSVSDDRIENNECMMESRVSFSRLVTEVKIEIACRNFTNEGNKEG